MSGDAWWNGGTVERSTTPLCQTDIPSKRIPTYLVGFPAQRPRPKHPLWWNVPPFHRSQRHAEDRS